MMRTRQSQLVLCESSLAALQAKHLDHRVTITPKHPCPSKLELDSLELPVQGDPAREKILEMQTETRYLRTAIVAG
jgi:hypothetical protein